MTYAQGHTEGYDGRTFHLNSMTIMNGAKLTAADTTPDCPTLTLLLNSSLRVMAGGLVRGKWLDISTGDIDVEASAVISADGLGHGIRTGPGSSSGKTALSMSTSFLRSIKKLQPHLKPWPNGLASRPTFWTCVQLAFRLATHLRRLASTCVDLR